MVRTAILISLVFAVGVLKAALPAHTVSPSREFVIYGGDATLRGSVSELAEQTKMNFLALLRQHDQWKTAVIINLQPQQANLPEIPPTDLRVTQTGFGVKFQLDLIVGEKIDGSSVERQLLRATLLEMIYRGKDDLAPGTTLVQPPDWLVEGALALAPGRDHAALVEALSTSSEAKSLDEFLGQRIGLLDSTGRALYQAYSLALVQGLLDEDGGRTGLARYIANLSHASNDPVADLKGSFSQTGEALDKIWRSAAARLTEHKSYQLLTFVESERRLDELLHINVSDRSRNGGRPKPADLAELAGRKMSPEEKIAVNEMSRPLLVLIGTAHPVLRPVAREYLQIAMRLARGKRRGMAKRLSQLSATRKALAVRMGEIDDYMNWFEATQMETQSGDFKDYLKAANRSQVFVPRRRDPLSVYLDALEDQVETSGSQ